MRMFRSLPPLLLAVFFVLFAACGVSAETFDLQEALREQTVQAYLAMHGSLSTQTTASYTPEESPQDVIRITQTVRLSREGDRILYYSETESMGNRDREYYDDASVQPILYISSQRAGQAEEFTFAGVSRQNVEAVFARTLSGLDPEASLEDIRSRSEDGLLTFECRSSGADYVLVFDEQTGWLTRMTETGVYAETGAQYKTEIVSVFAPAEGTNPGEALKASVVAAQPAYEPLRFTSADIHGNSVDESVFSSAKVVLLNFWEPWCPWCTKEMPDLEALYKKYREDGLVILGIYDRAPAGSSPDTALEMGITYPLIRDSEGFAQFNVNNWPTSFFLDGEGNMLSPFPVKGYQSLEDWETVILGYLNAD